ncbi:MAG: serine/threonine-protein kinase, partial [Myxococcota bacterium]
MDSMQQFIGKQFGSATLESEIGRGAMGAVFRGHQNVLKRPVAVKIMLTNLMGDKTAAQRFHKEALATASLKSPHIVQIYDAGVTKDGLFFMVMEFLEGETLDTLLERKQHFHLQDAIHLIQQIASGLQTAHQSGLTHRDIKPSNIIVDPQQHATITDFGLVRNRSEVRQTQTNVILGTPAYLAPEQASNVEPDARTDIYSLGIVFYEMLTG